MSDNHESRKQTMKPAATSGELPLTGQTVLVTRAHQQARSLCERLEQLGAKTIVHPVIQILPMDDPGPIDDVISRLGSFDWIVFVSANGVQFFLDRLENSGRLNDGFRQKQFTAKKFAAIGSSTRSQLKQAAGVETELTPANSNSESLADALIEAASGQRVLLVRASRGSQELPNRLQEARIDVEELAVYQSVDVESVDPALIEQLNARQIDWVTMTSSAIARSAIRLFGTALENAKTVSISPTTTAAMAEMGFRPDAEASVYNMDGMVEAILKHGKHASSE